MCFEEFYSLKLWIAELTEAFQAIVYIYFTYSLHHFLCMKHMLNLSKGNFTQLIIMWSKLNRIQ